MNEIWKEVSVCPEVLVSNLGRIKNNYIGKGNQYLGRIREGKKLKCEYLSIRICKNYKVKVFRVHNLVALAFIGERPHNFVVNHKDGNKQNNRLDNLEYVSRSDNAHHSISLNHWPDNSGENQGSSRLKNTDILEIRRLYTKGLKQKYIAVKFQTKQSYISQIINRRRWKCV